VAKSIEPVAVTTDRERGEQVVVGDLQFSELRPQSRDYREVLARLDGAVASNDTLSVFVLRQGQTGQILGALPGGPAETSPLVGRFRPNHAGSAAATYYLGRPFVSANLENAELTPLRTVDRIPVGRGRRGPVTEEIQARFLGMARGELPDTYGWLTHVPAHAGAL